MPQDVQKDAPPDMGRDAEQAPEAGPAGTEIDAPLSPAAARSRDRRHRRRGIRRVLAVGLVGATLAVAIVLAVGFASFREFAASNRLREELLYSSLLRSQLESIFEALLSAESGTLGYIVTGREEFLEPLAKARDSLPGDIAALIAEAWARPQHAAALAELAQLSVTEVALLDQMVANRNAAGSLSASAILDTRRGKMVMDEIRELVKAVSASELALSDARTHDVRRASQRTKETLLLLLSAVIAVVVGSSLVMVAHLIGRRRAELQLAETLTNHRAILSSAMDAIVTVDADGRIARPIQP